MLALYIFVTHLLQGDCDICAIQKLRGFAIYCIKYTARLSTSIYHESLYEICAALRK